MSASTLQLASTSGPAVLGAATRNAGQETGRVQCSREASTSGESRALWGRRSHSGLVGGCDIANAHGWPARSMGSQSRRGGRVQAILADRPRTDAAPQVSPARPLEDVDLRQGGAAQPVTGPPQSAEAAELGLTDSYAGGLASTWEHRAWVAVGSGALLGTFLKGLTAIDSVESGVAAAAAIVAAYLLSDLGTGVYHWGVDNYGDASTPIFGPQIDAFQGHHKRPWTITQRQFANNLQALCRPAAFFMAPFLLLPSNAPGDCFLAVFVAGAVFSQQFHAWAHMKKSQIPPVVLALQEAGVLVSRKAHGAHHRPPFEGNYCIVSGIWNKTLDRSGLGIFQKAEHFIYKKTGVAPRNWSETGEDFKNVTYFEFPGSESE